MKYYIEHEIYLETYKINNIIETYYINIIKRKNLHKSYQRHKEQPDYLVKLVNSDLNSFSRCVNSAITLNHLLKVRENQIRSSICALCA